eukprot:scaffold628_cov401-Prasinococcus_capsulatus_cf.AAC.9
MEPQNGRAPSWTHRRSSEAPSECVSEARRALSAHGCKHLPTSQGDMTAPSRQTAQTGELRHEVTSSRVPVVSHRTRVLAMAQDYGNYECLDRYIYRGLLA